MSDMKPKEANELADIDDLHTRFDRLVKSTNREDPDPEDLALLRRIYREAPVLAERAGNLAKLATSIIITELTTSACARESTQVYLKYIRNELGYDSAPMLEKLLIEQVVICWLRLYEMEMIYSQIRSGGPVMLDQGSYYERRLSAAQRRFLRACTTLARIRKMAGRTPELMQLNIGAQQVNVAQVSDD